MRIIMGCRFRSLGVAIDEIEGQEYNHTICSKKSTISLEMNWSVLTRLSLSHVRFSWVDLRGDLFGGVTAAVVALPLALAVGALTNVGAAAGLYGAIFTGIFAALFGGTATQITGPTLTTMAVVMTTFAAGGWAQLALATLFAGLFQILFGLLRLGRFITFIPQPVIAGFTNGMAAYIFAKQIPTFSKAPLIGLAVMAIMWVWPRINKVIPGSLVALVLTTAGAYLLGWTSHPYLLWDAAPVIGAIPKGFPAFYLPTFGWGDIQPAFVAGLTLALIASMESLLSALIIDDMTNSRHQLDQELIGQGIGNLIAPFFHGIIGNGAIVRSVVNTRAGGRTRLSGVIHGLMILVITLALGGLAKEVPMPTLAGILMMTAIGMVDWQSIKELQRHHLADGAVMVVTAVLTFAAPLTLAIGVGVLLSALLFAMRMSQSHVSAVEVEPGLHVITVDGPLFFGDATLLQERAEGCHGNVVADLSRMMVVDATGAVALRKLIRRVQGSGCAFYIAGLGEGPKGTLEKLGVLHGVTLCPDLQSAIEQARPVEPEESESVFA
jgi:SulP family sulfate permease